MRAVCGQLARELLERLASGGEMAHQDVLRLAAAAHLAGADPALVALAVAAEGRTAVTQAGTRLALACAAALALPVTRTGAA